MLTTTMIPEKYIGAIWNFNPDTRWTVEQIIENTKAGKILETLVTGGTIGQDDKEWVTSAVNENLYTDRWGATVRIMGYALNFGPYMKTYLANTEGRTWMEYRAFNVKALRKYLSRCAVPYAAALKIIELEQK